MIRLLKSLGELFALWTVVTVLLFLFVWLVVPRLIEAPAGDQPQPINHTSARTA